MDRGRLYASGVVVPVLLATSALAVALALYEANWGPGLEMLPWLLVGAVLLGILLARSVLEHWVLHLASLALGFILTLFATAYFAFPEAALSDAVQITVARLDAWFQTVRLGLPSQDALPFSFLLALSLWMAFHFSTWLIYRSGKVWWAVVGPAVALMLTTYYSPEAGNGYILVYAFCALLLIVRVSVQGLTDDWRLARIPHDRTVGEDFIVDAAYIVAAAVVVAWLLPPAALEQKAANLWVRFERPWRLAQQRFTDLFPTTGGQAAAQTTIYGDSLVMGGPVRLAADPLFEVTADEPSRVQGMVYDLYDGRQWWSSASSIALLEPTDYPTVEVFRSREFVEQSVTALQDTRSLLAAPSPKWFSVPVKSEHVGFSPEDGLSELDVYAATARRALAAGEGYQTLSAVSVATKEMLRDAGTRYPDWLSPVYLNLPANLPSRVTELAAAVTEGLDSPYAQAEALEDYLRELDYNTEIAAPPAGRDAVDYFLFDSREGYCNYFASSMVIMARGLGIPARVVAGYAPGPYDPERGSYTLLGSGAHSWPQLFFPTYGWIDFEPTPSQARVARPEPVVVETTSETPPPSESGRDLDPLMEDPELLGDFGGAVDYQPPVSTPRWPWAVAAGLTAVVASVVGFWVWPRRGLNQAERIYSNLVVLARALGVRPLAHETPLEYAARVTAVVPGAGAEVREIVGGFCAARYGDSGGGSATALEEAWARLRRETGRSLAQRVSYVLRG